MLNLCSCLLILLNYEFIIGEGTSLWCFKYSWQVLMATNRIDILDQALLRPGRIDRKIEFPNPNEDVCSTDLSLNAYWIYMITYADRALNPLSLQSRFDILKIHSRKMNLMRGIDLKKIAEKMNGASGAELKVGFIYTHIWWTACYLLFKVTSLSVNPSQRKKYVQASFKSSCKHACDI